MSNLLVQYSGGTLYLRRSLNFSPSHVIVSHVTSLEASLGVVPWKVGVAFNLGSKLIIAYICYSHDAIHLIIPEVSCRVIAENPQSYWTAFGIPNVIAQAVVTGSNTVKPGAMNVIDSNNVLTYYSISEFQFNMFLKAWDLDL